MNNHRRILYIFFSFVFLTPSALIASPIQGISPTTIFSQGTNIRAYTKDIHKENPLGVEMNMTMRHLVLAHSFKANTVFMTTFMDVDKEMGTRKTSGLGDTMLMAKYRFYKNNFKAGSTMASLIGAVKFHTGSYDEEDEFGLAPIMTQPGTGTTDYLLGTAFGHLTYRYNIEGGLRYRLNGKHNNFKFGDSLLYDLTLQYKFYPSKPFEVAELYLTLEFNGTKKDKDESSNVKIKNSGGNSILISPGLQYIFNYRFLAELSYQVPLVEKLNGTQFELEDTILFGISYIF